MEGIFSTLQSGWTFVWQAAYRQILAETGAWLFLDLLCAIALVLCWRGWATLNGPEHESLSEAAKEAIMGGLIMAILILAILLAIGLYQAYQNIAAPDYAALRRVGSLLWPLR